MSIDREDFPLILPSSDLVLLEEVFGLYVLGDWLAVAGEELGEDSDTYQAVREYLDAWRNKGEEFTRALVQHEKTHWIRK